LLVRGNVLLLQMLEAVEAAGGWGGAWVDPVRRDVDQVPTVGEELSAVHVGSLLSVFNKRIALSVPHKVPADRDFSLP
jgi:hypothetical protein